MQTYRTCKDCGRYYEQCACLNNVQSVKLDTGHIVLAKVTQYGLSAYTFANTTQAARRAEWLKAHGMDCYVSAGYPKYVVLA